MLPMVSSLPVLPSWCVGQESARKRALELAIPVEHNGGGED